MNCVYIDGRMAQDPQVRVINDKLKVVNFSLAVNTKSKDKDKSTIFVNVTAWNKTGEQVMSNFVKGNYVALAGHLHVESFTNKDGVKVVKTGVVADQIFNGTLPAKNTQNKQTQEENQYSGEEVIF